MLHIKREKHDQYSVIRLKGELDFASRARVQAVCEKIYPQSKHIAFDIRECDFIDSEGVSALLKVDSDLRKMKGSIALISSPEANNGTHRILTEVLKISNIIPTFPDEGSAALAFGQPEDTS